MVENNIMLKLVNIQTKLTEKGFVKGKVVDAVKYKYKYIPLEEMLGIILPIVNAEGCIIKFGEAILPNGYMQVWATLRWGIGQNECLHSEAVIPSGHSNSRLNPQQEAGAVLTYGRRYALMGLLGIQPEEDETEKNFSNSKPGGNNIVAKKPKIKMTAEQEHQANLMTRQMLDEIEKNKSKVSAFIIAQGNALEGDLDNANMEYKETFCNNANTELKKIGIHLVN